MRKATLLSAQQDVVRNIWKMDLKVGLNKEILSPIRESSSKLNTTQTTENCLTKKAHKKYLESNVSPVSYTHLTLPTSG